MSFGQNLVFLRKMHNQMTQEELAEKMGVSRQTISKWELDDGYPEMNHVLELCKFFSCSMDDLIRTDMNVCDKAFSNIRFEELDAFQYLRYAVISIEAENVISCFEKTYRVDEITYMDVYLAVTRD